MVLKYDLRLSRPESSKEELRNRRNHLKSVKKAKSTVLHYSDKHNFPRPSGMKRITPKKPEPRAKKAKLDVGKRLQEIAQHDELLRREGVAAAERARGRLAVLRGQNEPPTFRQAHADH